MNLTNEPQKLRTSSQGEACSHEDNAVRCGCGSLLARRLPDGIELKCRRCKRLFIVPFEPDEVGVVGVRL